MLQSGNILCKRAEFLHADIRFQQGRLFGKKTSIAAGRIKAYIYRFHILKWQI